MSLKINFVVQTFIMKRKQIVPGIQVIVPTASAALKKAETMAARAHGTAAVQVVADDETGELESSKILGQFGAIPDDFLDMMSNG